MSFNYQINKNTALNISAYVLDNLPVELLIGKETIDLYILNDFLTPTDEAMKALGLADSFAAIAIAIADASENDVYIREAYSLEKESTAGLATTMPDGYTYEDKFKNVFDVNDKSGARGLPNFDLQRKDTANKDFLSKGDASTTTAVYG